MQRQRYSFTQAIVSMGILALGAFLLMTGSAVIVAIVAPGALMLLLAQYLFGRLPADQDDRS